MIWLERYCFESSRWIEKKYRSVSDVLEIGFTVNEVFDLLYGFTVNDEWRATHDGLSHCDIAELFQVDEKVIRRILQKFKEKISQNSAIREMFTGFELDVEVEFQFETTGGDYVGQQY